MMRMKSSIFPQWMATALVATLLVMGIGGTWLFRSQKQAVLHTATAQLDAIGRLKVDQLVAWREERLGDAAVLMENTFVAQGVARYLADPRAENASPLLSLFRSLRVYYHYADVLLIDLEGRVLLRLSKSAIYYIMATIPTDSLDDGKPILTELRADSKSTAPHLDVIAPIFSLDPPTKTPLGAVVLVTDTSRYLNPLIQTWPTPSSTAETLLVRREGDNVLFLNDLRYRPNAALKLSIPLSRTDVPAVMAVLGRHGVFRGEDYRGVEVLSVILPVPNSPWFMIAKQDVAEVFSEWRFRERLMLGLYLALLGGLVAIGLIVWQQTRKSHFQALYASEVRSRIEAERLGVTLNAIGDAVIATDIFGRIELLNPVAEIMTGWTSLEAQGLPLDEVFRAIHEETRKPVDDPVAKVVRNGAIVGLANHTLLIAKDGSEKPIADSAAPIRNEPGEVIGVVLVFRDQTAERVADAAIRESEEKYRALIENLSEIILILDKDGINRWNSPAVRQYGMTPDDAIGISALDYAHPDDRDRVAEAINYVVENPGEIFVLEDLKVIPADGHMIYLDDTLVYLPDAPGIHGIVVTCHDVTERKQAEDALQRSESRHRTLFESSHDAIMLLTHDGFFDCNQATLDVFGFSTKEEFVARHPADVSPPEQPDGRDSFKTANEMIATAFREGSNLFEWVHQRLDGTVFPATVTLSRLELDGEMALQATVRDTTERHRIEQEQSKLTNQLHQAQKMESVGRLAGGIAHDFNNMLGVILGHAEIAMQTLGENQSYCDDLIEIKKAAKRSSDLTQQLLSFARKQTIAPEVLDVNKTIAGMLKMLGRLIGEDISLLWIPGADLRPIVMDPSQIDQMLANLCINASDAITDVGKITIQTSNETFDEAYSADHAGAIPGDFVKLAVSDNGCGMDQQIRDRLFEPFFTTKEDGKGTGLGLSTVYGIVKQNDGYINVYSEPGHGTTFSIYIPGHAEKASSQSHTDDRVSGVAGNETVLLVEDEPGILNIAKIMLERHGYNVLPASAPDEAFRLAEEHKGEIHLLVTDVVMPGMNGRDLAESLLSLYPDLKCLYMSGYTADAIAHHGVLESGVFFIQKPFSMKDFLNKLRQTLEHERE